MNDSLIKTAEFNLTYGCPVYTNPIMPEQTRWELRAKLLREELEEYIDACKQNDPVLVLDALGDIQYILSGSVHEHGYGSTFDAAFAEIHRSNMSKSHETLEAAQETQANYTENGVETYIKQVGNYFNVYRSSDDKVLKNLYYSPAQLESFVYGSPVVSQ